MEKYHNYHPTTFEFIRSNPMKYSPLDKEPAPPQYSTTIPLPNLAANETAVFDESNQAWRKVPDFRGQVYFLADGTEVSLELGEKPTPDMLDALPAIIQLGRIKDIKRNEIRSAFYSDVSQPVTVAGVEYNGGMDSAIKLDGAKRLAEMAVQTEVVFTDINNLPQTLAFGKASDVILAVFTGSQAKFLKKQQKMVDIENATDEPAVNAVVY